MIKNYLSLILIWMFLSIGCIHLSPNDDAKKVGGHIGVNVYYVHPDGVNTMLKGINLKLFQRVRMRYELVKEVTTGERGVSFEGLEDGKYNLKVSDVGETGSLKFPEKEISFSFPEEKSVEINMSHKLLGRVYIKTSDGEKIFQATNNDPVVIKFTKEAGGKNTGNTAAGNTIFLTKNSEQRYGMGYFGLSYHNDGTPILPESNYKAVFTLKDHLPTEVIIKTNKNAEGEFKKVTLEYINTIDLKVEETQKKGGCIPPECISPDTK